MFQSPSFATVPNGIPQISISRCHKPSPLYFHHGGGPFPKPGRLGLGSAGAGGGVFRKD